MYQAQHGMLPRFTLTEHCKDNWLIHKTGWYNLGQEPQIQPQGQPRVIWLIARAGSSSTLFAKVIASKMQFLEAL